MSKLIFLLSIPFFLSISSIENSTSEKSIHDLIKSGSIKCSVITNGGYNTESITLKISNNGKGQRVLIPFGTRFKSALDEDQDLIVPQDVLVELPRNGQKEVILDAYCVQQNNLSPKPGQVFDIAFEEDEALLKVLGFMKGKEYSSSLIQEAVWAVTDDSNVAGISMQNEREKELREFICEATGRKNVWYDLDREYQQDKSFVKQNKSKEI